MDEKTSSFKPIKQNRGKFNAVDLLIVLAVLGVIAAFVLSGIIFTDSDGERVRLEYTVLVEGVDELFYDRVKVGDRIYDSSSGEALGYVSKIDKSQHYAVYEYDGEQKLMVAKEYPDKYNFKITVSSNSQFVDNVGYSISGRRIAVGVKLDLRFPDYVTSGYCVDINPLK